MLTGLLFAVLILFILTTHAGGKDLTAHFLHLPIVRKALPDSWDGRILISEVMYDPFGSEPEGEWIEIYNSGRTPVDLSDFKIGDAWNKGDKEGMLRFPPGTVIGSRQVMVIAHRGDAFLNNHGMMPDLEMVNTLPDLKVMGMYLTWANRVVNLANNGDEVVILNEADERVDAVSWGSSELAFSPPALRGSEGCTLERYPYYIDTDSAKDWRVQCNPSPGTLDYTPPTPTPTLIPTPTMTGTQTATGLPPTITLTPTATLTATPFLDKLLISEVLYDPFGSEPDGEWIEIYNPGNQRVYLAEFKIGDEETQGGNEGMLAFPHGSFIEPGQVMVIANRGVTFYANYQFKPDFEMVNTDPAVPVMQKYTAWAVGNVNLANVYPHDEVLILDGMDNLVDAVSYGSSTWAFNPSVPAALEGYSLERYPPGVDTDTALDWRAQASPNPGVVDLTPPTSTPTPTATPTSTPTPSPTSTPTSTHTLMPIKPTLTFTPTGTHTLTPVPIPDLVINEIHAHPHPAYGDANGDGEAHMYDDEFIELVNVSVFPAMLQGWSIWNSEGLQHEFPAGTIVPPGSAIIIFGGGSPAGDFGGSLWQTATSGGLLLIDCGDTIFIYDVFSNLAASYTYGEEACSFQSITRFPDVTGLDPLIPHTTHPESGGALFSPGTQANGDPFPVVLRTLRYNK
jgi:hypothetical protein